MRLASLAATWILVASFPQGTLYRLEEEGADVLALRAHGTLRAPGWAVREVLLRSWAYNRVSPYLAEHRLLHVERCGEGATDLPGCQAAWAYERYEPPFLGARDYAFRVEIVVDDLDRGGDFELSWEIDESHGKPPDGATHVRMNRGAWTVSPDGERARFGYRIRMDPGGSIPSWVVNVVNTNHVPSVIAAVEAEARKLAESRRARPPGP